MRDWSLKHLSNGTLIRDLKALAAQDCVHLAKLLAHLAEVQARQLYREAAQPHMHAYCVNVLHFSDDAAWKRIHVAGVARRFPALLEAIAEGRLHLTGACEIAAHLTPENAAQLLAAVTHKTKEQIKVVIAALAPRADLEEKITQMQSAPAQSVEAPPETRSTQVVVTIDAPLAPAQVGAPGAGESEAPTLSPADPVTVPQPPPGRVTPLAPERYGIQFTMDQATRELLQKAQDLLGDPAERKLEHVFKRALALLVRDLERRKFAATDKPRPAKQPKSPHKITAQVKRDVNARDGGQCAFVNESGQRCPARSGLQYDHVQPVGRASREGRTAAVTASDVRLLCHAHNQLLAERVYGAAFMQHKREQADATPDQPRCPPVHGIGETRRRPTVSSPQP